MKKKVLTSIVFMLVFAVCSTAAFAGILKTPYLIYPGQNTQMEVLWQDTATETSNTLCWGTDTTYSAGCAVVSEYGSANQHKYTITGLTTNTTYYYQVTADGNPADGVYGAGSFITAPDDSATSIRFLGMGDSRTYPYNMDGVMQAMRNFYSQPGNSDYQRLVIHNGDWVSTDGESYWTSQWFDPTKTDVVTFTANSPINGVKGNHDNSGSYPNGQSTYFPKYFPFPYQYATHNGSPVTFDPATVQTYGNLYYSFDYGPVHFTLVDNYSNVAVGSAQYNWVVNDLSSTTKPWKILIYHEPAYSAGSDGDNTNVRVFEPLITQYNVDLVYCGHSHNYARTGAYNTAQANGDPLALNVPHFTNGGGGAPVYQPDMTNTGNYPHVITAWPADEFMTFEVEGKTLTITAYQVNGLASYASGSITSGPLPSNLTLSPIETVALHHFNNVSSQVSVTSTGFLYSRATGLYTGKLTVTNNGPAISGKVHVVLDGILNLQGIGSADNQYSTTTPKLTSKIAANPATGKTSPAGSGLISNVTLTNATGSNNGEPMIQASDSGLDAGASITVPVQFSNPSNIKLNFNPVILQE